MGSRSGAQTDTGGDRQSIDRFRESVYLQYCQMMKVIKSAATNRGIGPFAMVLHVITLCTSLLLLGTPAENERGTGPDDLMSLFVTQI